MNSNALPDEVIPDNVDIASTTEKTEPEGQT